MSIQENLRLAIKQLDVLALSCENSPPYPTDAYDCIVAALAEAVRVEEENKKYKTALESIRDLETDCCSRCEGNGRVWADSKSHYPSHRGGTVSCGNCGGSGRILSEDAQELADQALQQNESE